MNVKWYEAFFEGVVIDVWRQAVSDEQTRLEVDFFERHLMLPPSARVLDVPCGLGRHSLELASRGHRVTGVDVSPPMIQECRTAAQASHQTIEWCNVDMRALTWQAEFDAAFCAGNSFGYLEPAGTRAFLEAVARALKPGARFALDYGMAAECILPRFREREWAAVGDVLFLEDNRYDIAAGCIETRYSFVRGGQTERRTGLHWVYTVSQVREFLSTAGLEPVALFSTYAADPFALGSSVLILVGQKV